MEGRDAAKLLETGLSDYSLVSIEWLSKGHDLRLRLVSPSEAEAEELVFRFVWAYEVEVRFEFGPYVGSPLLFESAVKPLHPPGKGWEVDFAFGGQPEGWLSLKCNDIVLAHKGT